MATESEQGVARPAVAVAELGHGTGPEAPQTPQAAPASSPPLDEWLRHCNEQALCLIERQGRTSLGLVPFVGAGVSLDFGYSNWRNLLLGNSPPHIKQVVQCLLDGNDFEGAAEALLQELGPDGFQSMVAVAAGDRAIDERRLRMGSLALLALLGQGPVVTTNFDRVLEAAFKANHREFESVVSGPRPDLIVDALHGNRHVLIKLHGDWQDRVGRTFTKSDYDANYVTDKLEHKRVLLDSVLTLLFSSRSLLFIGASLESDRTVDVLRKVHQEVAGVRHFAIMAVPATADELRAKEHKLRALGIMPLWYRAASPTDHDPQVHRLMEQIVERISVRSIVPIPMDEPAANRPLVRQPFPVQDTEALRELDAHFSRVVNLIHDGRLNFFLGSGSHWPTRLMAADFYRRLAVTFECEALQDRRGAVTQHILDRHGRDTLETEIDKTLNPDLLRPREAHELFGAWHRLKTPQGKRLPWPWVFTTNYDDVLEQVLRAERVPHHVFVYQADGEWQGRFCHRRPDGSLRCIDKPDNIIGLEDALVVVKLNGGKVAGLVRSYVSTSVDYVQLAARIPAVLPSVMRQRLQDNPLLFLGHSLSEPDAEAMIRYAHLGRRGDRSWAVVKDDRLPEDYWRECGVVLLKQPINLYLQEIYRRLAVPDVAAATAPAPPA